MPTPRALHLCFKQTFSVSTGFALAMACCVVGFSSPPRLIASDPPIVGPPRSVSTPLITAQPLEEGHHGRARTCS
jgi:hypothetical protein